MAQMQMLASWSQPNTSQIFTVNSVTELTGHTNGGKLTGVGTTTSTATNVTVNGTNASLFGDAAFGATNMPLTGSYTAIAHDGYNRYSTNTVTVNLTNNSNFQYDLNGNLTNDGIRNFVYDGENQLIQVLVSNQWMSQFQYDGRMRRRIRKEFTWTNSAWAQTNVVFYAYDGNVVVQERDQNNLPTATYTRGKDLSGSLEGAGGIGGLLARTDAILGQTAFYHADGNGNITMLINSSNAIVAKYLYDAFGTVLSASGPLAAANLYRFSSKEAHPNSGLAYYPYRYYDPNLQRWPNKDPLGEDGINIFASRRLSGATLFPPGVAELAEGPNLYAFVLNNSINAIDMDGRDLWPDKPLPPAPPAPPPTPPTPCPPPPIVKPPSKPCAAKTKGLVACHTCCANNFKKAEAGWGFFKGVKNLANYEACDELCAATFPDEP